MTIWFTSDTHFGHDAIVRLMRRPFADAAAMDAELIERWNARVMPDDTVWHLGDVAHRKSVALADYLRRLNGTIHLVRGNHDRLSDPAERALFASIHDIAEIDAGGHHLALCHYPMREWPKAWRGAWHLHGHVHGRLDREPHGFSLDAGADSHGFAPIGIERIGELLAARASPFGRSAAGGRWPAKFSAGGGA